VNVLKKNDYYGNKNIISNRLKAARENMGISQAELAAKMQVLNLSLDQQMISKIERNLRIVTDYELVSFCKALNIDLKWLVEEYYINKF
jgi:transcriptional regulator with XRE-family HTH domain